MSAPNTQLTVLGSVDNLRKSLAGEYQKQITNYFGDSKRALSFLSAVVMAVQQTPELLECEPTSVINGFMTIASLQLMPGKVGGQAYILPYNNTKMRRKEAQFILGYKGMVSLAFRTPIVKDIACEMVYEKDQFDVTNGIITHKVDPFLADRGEKKGAYAIIRFTTGGQVSKVMSMEKILEIAKEYSKSYGTAFSSWNNDPDDWMPKKTVLRQAMKLVPMDEKYATAIAKEDEIDGVIGDRLPEAKSDIASLTMGAALKKPEDQEAKAGGEIQLCPKCKNECKEPTDIDALAHAGVCAACVSKDTQ